MPLFRTTLDRRGCEGTRSRTCSTATSPMYLGKHVGGWSTTRIGRFYNGRDHSTVCYAIRRIESLRHSDPAVDAVIVRLIQLCRQDTAEPPIPTTNTVMKALSDHLDDSLIEELVNRISDRILSRLQLSPVSPDQLTEMNGTNNLVMVAGI
jgi:hypothetical protein